VPEYSGVTTHPRARGGFSERSEIPTAWAGGVTSSSFNSAISLVDNLHQVSSFWEIYPTIAPKNTCVFCRNRVVHFTETIFPIALQAEIENLKKTSCDEQDKNSRLAKDLEILKCLYFLVDLSFLILYMVYWYVLFVW
jgi:hypothetical protein